ncbi:cyclin-dependent kinase 2-interacting protein-like isoform X2 [Onthophagus taurus]|uniref:cyclin-dependent kinase 2-interacting protein-like isoform X2 n=1 Tax=Onthophagus taurus TaxID=166361 RepID=UPI000C204E88|nr:cyclin-dependent kinase 2-interacting protein-like isoform X2 [Onthophagus taurus]
MSSTPTKSPIQQSPAALAGQRNLTGLPRVTRDVIADFYNNIQKWNETHVNGALLVKQIALIKSDSKEEFPKGLDKLMDDLGETYRRLEVYAQSLNFLSNQLASMGKLQHQEEPLFFSLTCRQISEIVSEIAKAYNSELYRKEYVLSNIAYSKNRYEALFHAACWVHQQYVSNDIRMKLEALLVETGHKKM